MRSDASRSTAEDGFGLVETLIAVGILAAVSISVAQLFAIAALANQSAEAKTSTALLATEKMEQLRSLTWGFERLPGGEIGLPITDTTSDLSVVPSATGGPGLLPSPGSTLVTNTPYYVDYLDGAGQWVGTGGSPPPGTVYVRRWSVEPLPSNPNDTLVLQVMATTLKQELQFASSGVGQRERLPADTWLVSVKTRKAL